MKFQKSIFKGLLCAAVSSFVTCCSYAAETQVEVTKPFEIKNWTSKEVSVMVPSFGVEHQVRLELEACAPYKKYKAGSGSNTVLEIKVNGSSITGKQLLEKPVQFKYYGGREYTWVTGTLLRVLYGQNFELIPSFKKEYPGDPNPYRFVFDITNFAKSGQKNEIIFNYKHYYKTITLKVRNAKLVISKQFMHPIPNEKVFPAPTGTIPVKITRGKQIEPVKVFLSDGGAISVEMCKQKYKFLTRTTIPGGGWKTTVASTKGRYIGKGATGFVKWETPYYSVTRKITAKDDHIYVNDTITNKSKKLIGLMLETWFNYEDKAAKYLVAGLEAIGNVNSTDTRNPSVCVELKNSIIGIIPESDIFQAHINLFRNGTQIGIKDMNLGIESGKSVSMEWSIYPVANGGYWDFVNAIRRNWDVNYAIPGPFAFKNWGARKMKTVKEYVDWVKDRNLKMVCDGITYFNDPVRKKLSEKYGDKGRFSSYAHGTAMMLGTDFNARVAYARDILKKFLPDLEFYYYFHAQVSSHQDGHKLYDDSIAYDSKGDYLYYSSQSMKMYIPTLTNKYGKALWDCVEFIIDKMNMNLYWDEMTYSMQRMIYDTAWDGCTVELDNKFNVARKITCVPLAEQPFKLKVISYIKKKGKKLLANSQVSTATMRKQKVVRFQEAGTYDNIYKTNLGCIIGLSTHHPERTPEDTFEQVFNFLKRGALYYSDYSIPTVPKNYYVQYMFPTTPVEIYEGIIFGQERIITCKSGIYTLPENAPAKIVAVSPKGLVVDYDKLVKEIKTVNGYKYEVRIPSNYIVILIKVSKLK